MKRAAWALLALAASPDRELTRVQLQKALFLFGKGLRRARSGEYYRFRPYHYGPFDPLVYTDLEAFNNAGLVEQIPSSEYSGSGYRITDAGLREAKRTALEVGDHNVQYVSDVVDWLKPLTFSELVSAIYEQFPDFKKNSIFRSAP